MNLKKEYTTWMPMILKLAANTRGPILELGSGPFSTPLLHWLCAEKKRELWTYEDSPEYMEFAQKFRSRTHHIRFVEDWEKTVYPEGSIALIDQMHKRAETAILLKDTVEFVVLHDSESPEVYGYDQVWPHFKYRYDWIYGRPWTTVLSNQNKLSWLV